MIINYINKKLVLNMEETKKTSVEFLCTMFILSISKAAISSLLQGSSNIYDKHCIPPNNNTFSCNINYYAKDINSYLDTGLEKVGEIFGLTASIFAYKTMVALGSRAVTYYQTNVTPNSQ